ncbi:MAG TPA: AraC family transcriptional regulator [Bosea sp. (in: a-proteobacteria)]|jgi:AraC-like DNA-binding protein|nr:AraC family transcriptional regulator [Bosea sp. (in: a-proteobacteria)]
MLRSIQQLRDTSTAAALLADSEEQLALFGGGGEYHVPWHWHDCLMIFLPEVGAVDFRDETRRAGAWLSEERFVVVPKAMAHQTTAVRSSHRHMAIYATDNQLAMIEARVGSLSRARAKLAKPAFFATTPEIRSLQRLCRAGGAEDKVSQAARSHLAAALLINCLAQIERSDPLSAARPEGHGDMLVSEIKSFITQNAGKDLRLDLIADLFGISRRHATRLFRENTGLSIAAFQEQERIRRARELLSETGLAIGEIAWRVGFESGSALARTMRRVTGLTPTDLRKGVARSDKP